MFEKDLIFLNSRAKDLAAVVGIVTPYLLSKRIVRDDFLEQLLAREKEYPTGFDLGFMGIAIPHVASEFVFKNRVWFMNFLPGRALKWRNIEDGTSMTVSCIVGLLISNPDEQIDFLMKLPEVFKNEEALQSIVKEKNNKDYVFDVLSSLFGL